MPASQVPVPDAPDKLSKSELRRAAFLAAAREVFLEQGYEAANMSEIVRRAGGSLTTLYNQFGDKQGIFLAMLEVNLEKIYRAMELELQSHAPIQEGLYRIGMQFTQQLLQPDSLELYRVLIGMARKFPEISRSFNQKGPDKVRATLAAYLRDRAEAGEIVAQDALQLASLFLDMVRSGMQTRVLMDPDAYPTPEELEARVQRTVHVFLNGVGR